MCLLIESGHSGANCLLLRLFAPGPRAKVFHFLCSVVQPGSLRVRVYLSFHPLHTGAARLIG
jgi:hypothetical protein